MGRLLTLSAIVIALSGCGLDFDRFSLQRDADTGVDGAVSTKEKRERDSGGSDSGVQPRDSVEVPVRDAASIVGTDGAGGSPGPTLRDGGTQQSDAEVIERDAAILDGGEETPEHGFKAPCIRQSSDLALIGDSYINYQYSLEPRLTQRAVDDAAITQGQRFDDHAISGSWLADGFILIPDQWNGVDGARTMIHKPSVGARQSPPEFIVMTGGAIDIQLGNPMCLDDGMSKESDPSCATSVSHAVAAASGMLEDMKASGVSMLLYLRPPDAPSGGHDVLGAMFDSIDSKCSESSDDNFQCFMVDLRSVFEGHTDWFAGDQITLSADGADAAADAVWAAMRAHCMAQSATSGAGCCAP